MRPGGATLFSVTVRIRPYSSAHYAWRELTTDLAIYHYRRALTLTTNLATYHYRRALTLTTDLATYHHRWALTLTTDLATYHRKRALTLTTNLATYHYRRALTLTTNLPTYHYRRATSFEPQGLANTAWAFAKLQHNAPELFDALGDAACSRLHDFEDQVCTLLTY